MFSKFSLPHQVMTKFYAWLFGFFFNISNSRRLVIHHNHGPLTREEEGIEKTLGMRLQGLTHAAYQQNFALYNLHVKMV